MNIVTQLQGGLGNQPFQYATARYLALQKEACLSLDCNWYSVTHADVTPRKFLLKELNIANTPIFIDESFNKPKKFRKIFQRLLPLTPFIFHEKSSYKFDASLGKLPVFRGQNLYLIGYWQSYKYFSEIRSLLQKEIKPKRPLDSYYQNYLCQIKSTKSSMVHIRRGDYVNLASAARIHGFLGIDYYANGMRLLLEKNPDTHFFIFSDDIHWALENLPNQKKCTFIKSLDSTDNVVQELELMVNCQNHLIANSSLSWWSAWLGNNDGIVICPNKWTSDPKQNFNDLLLTEWYRI